MLVVATEIGERMFQQQTAPVPQQQRQQPRPQQQQPSYQTTSGSESDYSQQQRRPVHNQQQRQTQQPQWTDDDEWSSEQQSEQPAVAEDRWQQELEDELQASQRAQSEAEQWRLYNAQLQASRRKQQLQDDYEADQQASAADDDAAAAHSRTDGQRMAVVVTDADQEHAEQQDRYQQDRYQQQQQQQRQPHHQVELEESEAEEDPRAAELMRQQMFAHFNRSHSVPVLPQPVIAPAVAAAPAPAQMRQSPGLQQQHSLPVRGPSASSVRSPASFQQSRIAEEDPEDVADRPQWNRPQHAPQRHPMEVVYAEDEEDDRPVLQLYAPSLQQQQQQLQQQLQQQQHRTPQQQRQYQQQQREDQQQRDYEQQRQEEAEWQWQQQQQEPSQQREQQHRATYRDQPLPQAQRLAANQLHRQQVLLEQQALRERDQQRAEQSVVRPPSAAHASSSFAAFAAASSRGGTPLRRADQPLPGQGRLNEISRRLQELTEQKVANTRAMASFSANAAASAAASTAATAASSTSSAARSPNVSSMQHSLSSIEPLDDSRSNLLDALRKIKRMRGTRGHGAILSHSVQANGLKSPSRDTRPGILAHSLSPSFAASRLGAGLKPLRMHGLLRNQALASSVELSRSKLIDASEVPSFLGQNSHLQQQASFAPSASMAQSQMSRTMHDLSLSAILSSPAARASFQPPFSSSDDAPPLVADALLQSELTKRQLEALKLQQVVLQQSHLALDTSVRNLGGGGHIDRSMLRPAPVSFVASSPPFQAAQPGSKHAAFLQADAPVSAVHSHRSPALQPRATHDDAEGPSLFLFGEEEPHRAAHEDRMAEQEIAMQQRQLQRSVLIAQQDAVLQQQQQLLMHNAAQMANSIATSMATPTAPAPAPAPPAPAPAQPAPATAKRSRYHPAHVASPYPYAAAEAPDSLADTVSAHDLQRQLDSTAQLWDEVDDVLSSHANTVLAPHASPNATVRRTMLASPATTIKANASSAHDITVPASASMAHDSSTTVQTTQGHSITVNVHPIIHVTQPSASPVAALHHSVMAAARGDSHTPQKRSPLRDAASQAAQVALSHYPVSHPSSARLAPSSPLDGMASAYELEKQKGIFMSNAGRVHASPAAQARPNAAGFAASAAKAFRPAQADPVLAHHAHVASAPSPESLQLEAELADFQAREFEADPSDDRYLDFMVAQKKRQLDQLTEVEQAEALERQKERMEFERNIAQIERAAREAEARMRKEEVQRQQAIAEVQSASRSRLAALSPEQQLRAHNRVIYEDRHEPDPLERSKPQDHSSQQGSPQRAGHRQIGARDEHLARSRAREMSPDRSVLISRRGLALPSDDEMLSAEEDAARQRTAAARAHISHMDAMEDAQRASTQLQRADDDAEFEEELRTERARAQTKWEATQKEIDAQTRAIIAEQVRTETAARHAILTRQREKADAEFAARRLVAEQEAMEDKARMDALRVRDEHLQQQRRERVEWEERQRQQAERDLRKREENLQQMRNERMDKEIQMRREIEQQTMLMQQSSHRVRVGSPIAVSISDNQLAPTPPPQQQQQQPAEVHSHRSDGVLDHPPSPPPSPPLARRRASSSPHGDDGSLPAADAAPIQVSVAAIPPSPSSAARQAKLAQQAQLIEQTKAQLALIQARTLEISSRPSSTVNSPTHGPAQPYQHHHAGAPESTPPRDAPLASHSAFLSVTGLPLPAAPLSAANSARENGPLPSLPPSADVTARDSLAPPPPANVQLAGPTPIPAPYPFLPGDVKPGPFVLPSARAQMASSPSSRGQQEAAAARALEDAAEQRAIEAALASPDPPARTRSSLLSPSTAQQQHDDAAAADDASASFDDSVDDFGFAKKSAAATIAETSQDGASFNSVSRSAAPSTRVGSGRGPAASASLALDASYGGGSSDDFGWLTADAELTGAGSAAHATPAPSAAADWRKQRAEKWGAAAATANATPVKQQTQQLNTTPAPTRLGRPGALPSASARTTATAAATPTPSSSASASSRPLGRGSRIPPSAIRASAGSSEAELAAMVAELEAEADTEAAAAGVSGSGGEASPAADADRPLDDGGDFDALIREAEDATTWLP